MTIGELKAIIDSLHDLHGPDARADFGYQKSAHRLGLDSLTGYQAFCSSPVKTIRFTIGHARGKEE